jgi:hypothetical protein
MLHSRPIIRRLGGPEARRPSVLQSGENEADSLTILGQTYSVTGRIPSVAKLDREWEEDVEDPDGAIHELMRMPHRPDLFTFWERLPANTARFSYHLEWNHIAALPIRSFEHWWDHQVKSNVRGAVRKAEKRNVIVRKTEFTDEFVQGIVEIFNETPFRQDRPFLHFGKDFETVKREFARNLVRETILGAYFGEELIGFVMLADAGNYSMLTQIISKIKHRDKAPTNALLARSVELCAARRVPYLVYAYWPDGPLADFKRMNGFRRVSLPRYYVPLTFRGRIALSVNAHRSWSDALPEGYRSWLKDVRKMYYRFLMR